MLVPSALIAVVRVIIVFPYLCLCSPPAACPCVRAPSGSECIAYNQRYQAATLEEAVTNFVDPTEMDTSRATNLLNQSPTEDTNGQCGTVECLACVRSLTDRVIQQIGVRKSAQWGISYTGVANVPSSAYCRRLSQPVPTSAPSSTKPPTGTPGPAPTTPNRKGAPASSPMSRKGQGDKEHRRKVETQHQTQTDTDIILHVIEESEQSNVTHINWTYSNGTGGSTRSKRESLGRVGVSTPLDCSIKRGSPLGDGSGYVGLCDLCWSLRTLSPRYFPRYINELTCHSSSNGCLAGYGQCRERYRSIDVLYNSGTQQNPKWAQYTINSPVACECQVKSGSALHNFISH